VNSTHPDYDASAVDWARARDVLSGEDAVKAPSNLSVSVEEGFFIVMWQDNSSDEVGFRVYRKEFSGDYYILVEFPEETTVFGDFDVEGGVYYTWYVVAFNGGGESARSNEVSAQLMGGP